MYLKASEWSVDNALKEYLNELQQHDINKKEKHSKNNVSKVWGIVLIKGEKNVPRTQWRIE